MIYDTLARARDLALGGNFDAAFRWLENTDLAHLPVGRYEIDGDKVYAMMQEAALKPWEEGRWEAHRRYADIQLVVEGEEIIGFRLDDGLNAETEYDSQKDLLFYQECEGGKITVHAGEMMVLFPQDAHRPCIRPASGARSVRKLVVKVAL